MKLLHGDCLEQMKTLPDNSIDAIVSDPPYGISFMAKKWDYDVPKVEVWQEAMRVLKPGGHALIACGTRTQHRMVVNIEDAGFEIRDVVSWIYGSGFPKSLNIGKAIDKARDDKTPARIVSKFLRDNLNGWSAAALDLHFGWSHTVQNYLREDLGRTPPWNRWLLLKNLIGFGDDMDTEVWRLNDNKGQPGENFKRREVVGRAKWKTLNEAPLPGANCSQENRSFKDITAPATEAAKQWDGWGTALKPACEFFTLARKPLSEKTVAANVLKWGTGGINVDGCRVGSETGRFPANLIHDGSDEVLAGFPVTKSGATTNKQTADSMFGKRTMKAQGGSQGSAARFFYCPKASKADRDEGNVHPTVKPTALMAYLCRLITPTGGTVLDPFMGSGSTGKAAVREGFDFIGCELDADYYAIATARIEAEQNREPEEPDQKELF